MLIITCPCAHEWVISTAPGVNWAHTLQTDPCPACGRDSGDRTANTAPDPSINDVLRSLAANEMQPCRVLSWSIIELGHNTHLTLVTINAEDSGGGAELIAEVDRRRDAITKAWFARTHPMKTDMRRLPVETLTGNVADLMLSIGMGEKPVVDWQAFAEKSTAVFRGKGETTDG